MRTHWITDAACGGIHDFTDWPPKSQKDLCGTCPVKNECALYGLRLATDRDANEGMVYGGYTVRQLAKMRARWRSKPTRARVDSLVGAR